MFILSETDKMLVVDRPLTPGWGGHLIRFYTHTKTRISATS